MLALDFVLKATYKDSIAMQDPRISGFRRELTKAERFLAPPRCQGSERKDGELVMNGILQVLLTGARWRELPKRYGL